MSQWIPVLLPKNVVKQILKEYIIPTRGEDSYMEILKDLQSKAKTMRIFTSMTKQQIISKLHKVRKTLLKDHPDAYIDYSA